VANHRDGGRDPTELELTVQPANTARPVGRHTSRKYPSQPVMGGVALSLAPLWRAGGIRGDRGSSPVTVGVPPEHAVIARIVINIKAERADRGVSVQFMRSAP